MSCHYGDVLHRPPRVNGRTVNSVHLTQRGVQASPAPLSSVSGQNLATDRKGQSFRLKKNSTQKNNVHLLLKETPGSSEMLLVQSMDFTVIGGSRRKCLSGSCCVKRGKGRCRTSKAGCSDRLLPTPPSTVLFGPFPPCGFLLITFTQHPVCAQLWTRPWESGEEDSTVLALEVL